jgi:hypothetical protein
LDSLRLEIVNVFCGILEYFTDIGEMFWPFGTFCVHWVPFFGFGTSCTNKNLATLIKDGLKKTLYTFFVKETANGKNSSKRSSLSLQTQSQNIA